MILVNTYASPLNAINSTIIIEGVDIVGGIKVTLMNVGLFFAKLFGLV
jgi:hypothetical protein